MSDEPATDGSAPEVASGEGTAFGEAATPSMPWWQRVLIGIGITIAVILLVGVSLYFFGGISGSVNDPVIGQQYDQLVAAGQVGAVEKRFVIPIPGCQCHSDDPYLTEQHRYRRIAECSGCHGGR